MASAERKGRLEKPSCWSRESRRREEEASRESKIRGDAEAGNQGEEKGLQAETQGEENQGAGNQGEEKGLQAENQGCSQTLAELLPPCGKLVKG